MESAGIGCVSAASLDLPEPEETGETFVENAELKAVGAAKAAGMRTIAIPNPEFPPPPGALAEADVVLDSLAELTPEAVTPRL